MARATIVVMNPHGMGRSQPGPIYIPRECRQNTMALQASVRRPSSLWFACSGFAIASIMFLTLNMTPANMMAQAKANRPSVPASATNTSVYRKSEKRVSFDDRWGELTPAFAQHHERGEETGSIGFTKEVHTISFKKPAGYQLASAESVQLASAYATPDEMSAPITLPPTQPLDEPAQEKDDSPAVQKALAKMDEVERYLWRVYERAPIKKDRSGDFTWKDPAAAKHMGVSMPEYVIGGMDPDFREQLYHAGKAMDADGVKWAILSAFRDDYRQRLASGYKASARNSLHGGSHRVGGYGHGRAVDVTAVDGDAEEVWHWLDKHGGKYGLSRPMPKADPAHIQSRGNWRAIAHALKRERIKTAEANAGTKGDKKAKSRLAKASK
jgi:hypothetical protein